MCVRECERGEDESDRVNERKSVGASEREIEW